MIVLSLLSLSGISGNFVNHEPSSPGYRWNVVLAGNELAWFIPILSNYCGFWSWKPPSRGNSVDGSKIPIAGDSPGTALSRAGFRAVMLTGGIVLALF